MTGRHANAYTWAKELAELLNTEGVVAVVDGGPYLYFVPREGEDLLDVVFHGKGTWDLWDRATGTWTFEDVPLSDGGMARCVAACRAALKTLQNGGQDVQPAV